MDDNTIDIDATEIRFAEDGGAWGELENALRAVYPTRGALARPVRLYLGEEWIVGDDARSAHYELVEAAAEGALLKLVAILIADKPKRVFLGKHENYWAAAQRLLDQDAVIADDGLVRLYGALVSAYRDRRL